MRWIVLWMACLFACSCSKTANPGEFAKLSDEFVNTSLSFSPVFASSQGLHEYKGQKFDSLLDDYSEGNIQRQRNFLIDFHRRMAEVGKASLPAEEQADYEIIDTQIGAALFDIDIAQSYRHSPQTYVEAMGNALYNPVLLEYAPKEQRYRDVIARLGKIPYFIRVAERQLFRAPQVWIDVAKGENEGNINLVDKTLRELMPAELKGEYEAAAGPALEAIRGFTIFLNNELPRRVRNFRDEGDPDSSGVWRLGAQNYATKFRFSLGTDRTPDQVLADAEARLKQVRASMLELAGPLHKQWFAGHPEHPDLVIKEVLDRIAQDHSTPASYMDDAKKDLEEARAFAREKNLLKLPQNNNLQVIPTPEFQRGIYGVGGFNPAPALEPQLGAFFWLTPIPPAWPKERVESKLREYNKFNLQLLVIHEAMPGHYVQFEIANTVQPKSRGVLRALYSNGPYVEGWAQYITQTMLDAGYLGNSPELRLTLFKQELRVDANAILDIRLQTNRMTDQEAMALMEKQTFQEHEEAVAKLQRAKLSSGQLPMYFVGWRDWLRVREGVKKAQGGSFNLHDFHDRALKEGGVSLPTLGKLLGAGGL